jgi:AbiV family abortive infection protein
MKKLDQYKGKLTPSQIAKLMNAAGRNAKRLVNDANLLLKNGRIPSAACLAILSIEESGKAGILRTLALARNAKERAQSWRDYRSHTKKNVTWLLPQLVAQGAKRLEELRPLFDPDAEHPYLLNILKQVGFYTDCLGKARCSFPQDVIDDRLAEVLVTIAEIMTPKREVSGKEIELWIKHLGPTWKGNMAWMKKALENWYCDMKEHGLIQDKEGDIDFQSFIHGDPDTP